MHSERLKTGVGNSRMVMPDDYEAEAEECERMAAKALDAFNRDLLLRLAEQWRIRAGLPETRPGERQANRQGNQLARVR